MIKPCPFCQSKDVTVRYSEYYVRCRTCYLSGPICDSEEESITAWNRLTVEPEPTSSGSDQVDQPKECKRCDGTGIIFKQDQYADGEYARSESEYPCPDCQDQEADCQHTWTENPMGLKHCSRCLALHKDTLKELLVKRDSK